MEKKERTVIHVEHHGRHSYFGSLKAIYTKFSYDDIGITYGSLRNFGISDEKPYVNTKCVIRKGTLKTIEKKG